jgi:hypothetical protein
VRSNIERDPPRRGPVEVWREVEIRDASAAALRAAAKMREDLVRQTITGASVRGIMDAVQVVVDDAMPLGSFMLFDGKLVEVGPTGVNVDFERGTTLVRMRFRPLDSASDDIVLRAEI